MIHVLKHVESITQHRDRSLLELGVASALFELVKANSAAENLIFSQQQPNDELLVKLRGKNYLVR